MLKIVRDFFCQNWNILKYLISSLVFSAKASSSLLPLTRPSIDRATDDLSVNETKYYFNEPSASEVGKFSGWIFGEWQEDVWSPTATRRNDAFIQFLNFLRFVLLLICGSSKNCMRIIFVTSRGWKNNQNQLTMVVENWNSSKHLIFDDNRRWELLFLFLF